MTMNRNQARRNTTRLFKLADGAHTRKDTSFILVDRTKVMIKGAEVHFARDGETYKKMSFDEAVAFFSEDASVYTGETSPSDNDDLPRPDDFVDPGLESQEDPLDKQDEMAKSKQFYTALTEKKPTKKPAKTTKKPTKRVKKPTKKEADTGSLRGKKSYPKEGTKAYQVWSLADEGLARSKVIEKCVKGGMKYDTAQWYFTQWLQNS